MLTVLTHMHTQALTDTLIWLICIILSLGVQVCVNDKVTGEEGERHADGINQHTAY